MTFKPNIGQPSETGVHREIAAQMLQQKGFPEETLNTYLKDTQPLGSTKARYVSQGLAARGRRANSLTC